MNIADRVYGILTSAATMRINFWFRGVNKNLVFVLAPDFILAANCLKVNKIAVVEGKTKPGEAFYTAKNEGDRAANTMYIGPTQYSRNFEALIVHETVHAIHDIKRSVIPWMDNEVAAYIAQGFYAKNIGIPDDHISRNDHIYYGKMIANDFSEGLDIEMWLDILRERLKKDPTYAGYINSDFIGDG